MEEESKASIRVDFYKSGFNDNMTSTTTDIQNEAWDLFAFLAESFVSGTQLKKLAGMSMQSGCGEDH